MGEFKVHCVRFFDYVPSGVRCMAFAEDTNKLALARNDGSVEVFSFSSFYYQEKVIPGDESRSIESICWAAGNRLFTAGLNGEIIEYDLEKLCVKYTLDAYGGPIWNIAANACSTHLAVSCEDGSVKLFSITTDHIKFERNLDRQKGRLLCVAWHPLGTHIVTGSVNKIQVFKASSGHLEHVLKLDSRPLAGQRRECVVWSVAVLSNGDIISVDSSGKLQFWDLEKGTLIHTHSVANCDILSLAVSKAEDSLVVGTAEGVVFQFQHIASKAGECERQWVRTKPFRYHTHDVRAVAHSSTAIISGGVEGHLVIRSLMEKIEVKSYEAALRKITFPHYHLVSSAQKAGQLLFQFPEHLELWQLGNTDISGTDGDVLPVKKKQELILKLKRKGSESIRCSSVSHCGSWICYATSSQLYLYRLQYEKESVSLSRVHKLPQLPSAALKLLFSPNSKRLYVGSEGGCVHVMEISDGTCKLGPTLQPPSESTNRSLSSVHLMAASMNGSYLAVAAPSSQIDVYNTQLMKYECSVPRYSCPPSALSIHPTTENLVIAYADRLMEFNIAQRQYTEWGRRVLKNGLHRDWLERDTPILDICFNPSRPEDILMHDNYMFCVLDKSLPLPDDKTPLLNQITIKHLSESEQKSRAHAFKITKRFQPLMFMDLLSNGDLVLVERPFSDIVANLPPPMKQKKFGT
ncbi:U3 small nucleolar RNA-associated protein 4 homolog isoform X4 [Xenopus laevis]|uniref:U3 small nucleolar RNA-associated protein 4 homolog isoform X4 n=1 Tax=Xenopus laevis TaxID=8355 RepID=A0A8J1KIF0_XENLA|nr:U3 small nucleolar RNA-associated protein 4 homolog isoform X4 [Xenopus laevis]